MTPPIHTLGVRPAALSFRYSKKIMRAATGQRGTRSHGKRVEGIDIADQAVLRRALVNFPRMRVEQVLEPRRQAPDRFRVDSEPVLMAETVEPEVREVVEHYDCRARPG
jgi:hypothetical protein